MLACAKHDPIVSSPPSTDQSRGAQATGGEDS